MKYQLKLRDSGGNLLEVWQELPDKGDKFPTVVMVPGFGVDLHEHGYFDRTSRVLVQNGIQVFRFSFEGTGKSEGKFVDMTLDKQVRQLNDIWQYVVNDRFTDRARMALLGQSFGSIVILASLPNPQAKTLLFTSCPADPYTSLVKYFRRKKGYYPLSISTARRSDGSITRIGPMFWDNLAKFDIFAQSQFLRPSVCFIHGSKDRIAPLPTVEIFYQKIKTENKFIVIKHADHGFTGKFRSQVVKRIALWFNIEDHL